MPKLAEALVERKGLQERFVRLQTRLSANAKVQEGDSPDEPPTSLLDEVKRLLDSMKRLTIQINMTNIQTRLPDGSSLMEAIAERDRLAQERKTLEVLSAAARISPQHQGFGITKNEVKWKATVDVADLQKQLDDLSQAYRLLDTHIQESNWSTDLIQN